MYPVLDLKAYFRIGSAIPTSAIPLGSFLKAFYGEILGSFLIVPEILLLGTLARIALTGPLLIRFYYEKELIF